MQFITGQFHGLKQKVMGVNYSKYLNVCRQAVKDDEIFKAFKSIPQYRAILEHVSKEQGLAYLEVIGVDSPYLLKYLKKFVENDLIGAPKKCTYDQIKIDISPTTLRYIKVLSDIICEFGCLDGLNIVEIGVGYGGQCKIIQDITEPNSYTLVDLPEVLALSGKYLNYHKISNILQRSVKDVSDIKYDLCISNYAFTELDRPEQKVYVDHIIKNSRMGYLTLNYMESRKSEDAYTLEEIITFHPKYKIIPERPLTASDNLIYTWNTEVK